MTPSDSHRRNAEIRQQDRYTSAMTFLFERIDYERVPKMPYSQRELNLDRMRRLLELLGDPHQQTKIVHVAGTKGKGSTSAFLSSVFAHAGLRCGSYTSPHLHHIEERFCLNNEPCSPDVLLELLEPVRRATLRMDDEFVDGGPTYFEVATAIAFLFYVHQNVDVAVLEVGMGGRLDSTNVCLPLVSVITSISFDHTKQLGNTLAKIAREKAGIIKPNVPIVSGATHPEARAVIEAIAQERSAPLVQLDVDFRFENYRNVGDDLLRGTVDFRNVDDRNVLRELDAVELGLPGPHQAANASLALAAFNSLPTELQPDEMSVRAGLAAARCDARIELVRDVPITIVDSAHNVASIAALMDVLQTTFPERRRLLLLGATKGKDIKGMLRLLLPGFAHVVCTKYENNPRGYDAEKLGALARSIAAEMDLPNVDSIEVCPTPATALDRIDNLAQREDLVCVTGSFFIAAEIREQLG